MRRRRHHSYVAQADDLIGESGWSFWQGGFRVHPFGTMKMRMGATHFLMKTLPKVATEMALCVLTYNLTRVLNIIGVPTLLEAIKG